MAWTWKALPAGAFGRRATVAGADPMWVWADATGYRDHGPDGLPADGAVWCVAERAVGGHPQFTAERHAAGSGADLALAELALPVVPERMPAPAAAAPPPAGAVTPSMVGKVLVGVIDSGCPFAALMLRDASRRGTRVLGLWDQDDDAPAFATGGFRPPGVGYGRAIGRDGLNRFMQQAMSPSGRVDAERAHQLAGSRGLRKALSHGAAVLSQLFAPALHGGALQPRPGVPPAWDDLNGQPLPIDDADLVFVDLPQNGLQDSSCAALARYLIDGLRYIVAHAVAGQRVVVNISSGSSRTGHDGSSLIERALAAAVDEAHRAGITLQLVLSIGNSNNEQRHAALRDHGRSLELFVPPGCESPQYVTVRWPRSAVQAQLAIKPPDGPEVLVRERQARGLFGGADSAAASAGVVAPPCGPQSLAGRWLLAFAPTASHDIGRARAPAGRWRIELVLPRGLVLEEPVQFWVSRTQRNPGALPRGRQADFVDTDRSHSPDVWMRPVEDDPSGATVDNGIRRRGAQSGLATAHGVLSVGSGIVGGAGAGAWPSPYSAASRHGPLHGPGVLAPGDASRMLRGLSVRGVHGGEIVRVMGTSFAAPLAARALVNGTMPQAAPGPQRQRSARVVLRP